MAVDAIAARRPPYDVPMIMVFLISFVLGVCSCFGWMVGVAVCPGVCGCGWVPVGRVVELGF
jgi:hypothetical protein